MASLTIRSLDDALKTRLRVRAAEDGRFMEEEARHILRRDLLGQYDPVANLDDLAEELFGSPTLPVLFGIMLRAGPERAGVGGRRGRTLIAWWPSRS